MDRWVHTPLIPDFHVGKTSPHTHRGQDKLPIESSTGQTLGIYCILLLMYTDYWWCTLIVDYHLFLVGGLNPSEKYERQLGWLETQYMGK